MSFKSPVFLFTLVNLYKISIRLVYAFFLVFIDTVSCFSSRESIYFSRFFNSSLSGFSSSYLSNIFFYVSGEYIYIYIFPR